MTHNINFNKIAFIDQSKRFMMPKYVFYNLSYAITMSNMIKKMIKNVLKQLIVNLMTHATNKND
jgi:hypothetical protein